MRSSSNAARGLLATLVCFAAIALATSGALAQNQPGDSTGGDKTKPADNAKPADNTKPADNAKPADGDKPGDGATPAPGTGTPGDGTTTTTTPAPPPEEIPINLRLRRLEQRVQALKERAWRAKARVGMLKEAVLGGGIGARATIVHKNKMGNSFRLIKLIYALDGTQIFARADDSGSLHKNKTFDVLTGPIAPGSHTVSVLAIYRGHGYGVFKYLNKYRFTVRSSHTFTAAEGKATRVEVKAFERGGVTTKLEKRPAIDFKVSHSAGVK